MTHLNHGQVLPAWKNPGTIIAFLLAVFTASFLPSCDNKDDEPPMSQAKVQLRADAQLGTILTDASNRTLYSFANDFNGENNCTGGCLNLWPVFYAGDNLSQSMLATGLDLADFGTVTTTAGTKQTTYKGWPL